MPTSAVKLVIVCQSDVVRKREKKTKKEEDNSNKRALNRLLGMTGQILILNYFGSKIVIKQQLTKTQATGRNNLSSFV